MQISTETHQSRSSFGKIEPPPKRYKGRENYSIYLPMRDGVRIAIDVILPKGLAQGDFIPALLIQSRYWRSMELRMPFKWFLKPEVLNQRFKEFPPFFTSRGYALVMVDVRGTGASYGVWRYPWAEDSIYDAEEIVDWIISQPWSNGRVAGWGISYLGTTAELLGALGHPAVKAIIPMFNHPDPYTDVAFPGGVFNERFIRDWGRFDHELDNNRVPEEFGVLGKLIVKGVSPVKDDRGRRMLKEALQEHAENPRIFDATQFLTCRDEVHPDVGACIDDMAVARFNEAIANSEAAIFGWGSWMDAGTADVVIRRYMKFKYADIGVIGAWEHGGQFHASPYQPPDGMADPPPDRQWTEMIRFLDRHMKEGGGDGYAQHLHYYTMGAEIWQSTAVWPPHGTTYERWYFDKGGRLTSQPVQDEEGQDRFQVDFEATTGNFNRWWELGGVLQKSVQYLGRAEAGKHMLTYTSPVLEADMEITGHPLVTLYVTSSEPDGLFIVYLEDEHPDGRVTYITEGQLRAVHRKLNHEPSPYGSEIPQHSYLEEDAEPLTPGSIAELSFSLHPTSVLVRKGHRLRIGIAGHDKGTFLRIPAVGNPLVTVLRNRTYCSSIELPVRVR